MQYNPGHRSSSQPSQLNYKQAATVTATVAMNAQSLISHIDFYKDNILLVISITVRMYQLRQLQLLFPAVQYTFPMDLQ